MSTVVADVVARFRVDAADMQSSLSSMKDDLDKLGDSGTGDIAEHFDKAGSSAKEMSSGIQGASGVVESLEMKTESLGNTVKNVMASAVGAAGIGALILVAKNAAEEMQTLGVQFNATFGAGGAGQMQQAIGYANQYGIAIGSAGSAWVQFAQATKGGSQNIGSDMKSIADIAAGTGTSVDQLSNSIGNYYQIIQRQGGEGGAASRYAQQLVTSHVITQQVANQLRIQANQGASPDQLLNTILAAGEQTYAGAGAAQSKTLGGELTTFKNNFTEALSGSGGGALSPLMNDLGKGLSALNQSMQSGGMKDFVKDIQNLIGAITSGVALVAPFAKSLLEVAGAVLTFVSNFGPAKTLIEGVVAALIALKAVDIGASMVKSALGFSEETGAITANTAAIEANSAAKAGNGLTSGIGANGIGSGGSIMSKLIGGGEAGPEATVGGAGMTGALVGLLPLLFAGGGIVAGHEASQALGGGNHGNLAQDALGGAGIGAGIGTMIAPGVGTAVGAGVGLLGGMALGLFTNHVNDAADAAKKWSDAVNQAATLDQAKYASMVTPGSDPLSALVQTAKLSEAAATGSGITGFKQVEVGGGYRHPGTMEEVPIVANPAAVAAANEQAGKDQSAERNAYSTVSMFQSLTEQNGTRMGAGQAASYLQANNVDISKPLQQNAQALQTLTQAFTQGGGLLQYNAEQLGNKLGFVASQVSGAYGESTSSGGTASGGIGYSDFAKLAAEQGINLKDYGTPGSGGITEKSYNTPSMTTGQAQLLNSNISAVQQLADAQNGLVVANQQVTQSQWSMVDAENSYNQAVWGSVQAAFSLSQAQIHMTTAVNTQAAAYSSVGTALSSGYVPANANVNTMLAQTTSLSGAQKSAILAEVATYNSLEAAMNSTAAGMNSVNIAGDSLSQTYTQLSGNVQVVQAQMQSYQDTLSETLQGQLQMNQAMQNEKLASAQTSGQMAQLQLAGYSTSSPEYINAQRQAAIESAESTLTQSQDTLGLGNEQFQISQAQLPPSASFDAMFKAAQGVGALQPELLKAKQALDAVAPAYDRVNTALSVQSQRNSAVTGSLNQLASADQTMITTTNGLKVAQQGVITANYALTDAGHGLTSATWAQHQSAVAAKDATWSLQEAQNTYASNVSQNMQAAISAITGSVQNMGTQTASITQAMSQEFLFMERAAAQAAAGHDNAARFDETVVSSIANGNNGNGAALNSSQINQIAQAFGATAKSMAVGGPVPGGQGQGIPAIIHGGEYVVPVGGALVLAGGGSSSSDSSVTVANGAIQLHLTVDGSVIGNDEQLMTTISTVVDEAFGQLVTKIKGK